MDRSLLADYAERTVDAPTEFAFSSFLVKLWIRKWLFALCVIVPTVVGLLVTALTPATYLATTKILIRYGTSESAFMQGLIPDNRTALSGAASSEILRSLPTLEETIRRYDIHSEDLYRSGSGVVLGRIVRFFRHTASLPAAPNDSGTDVAALARTFQDSLQESSKISAALGSKTRPIELLTKDSTIPQSMVGDELITLTVRAFNGAKVAEMTNGLAETFINRYYSLSEAEAHRSVEFLSLLAARSEAEIRQLEQNPDAPESVSGMVPGIGGGDGSIARNSPAMSQLTGRLAGLQGELARAQQVYTPDSTQIQRAQSEIANVKQLLRGEERLEVAREVSQQIKMRLFQATNTESLYRNHLLPISVVEPAVTPNLGDALGAGRFITSGLFAAVIGSVLGLAVITILGLIDQRLFTIEDVERASHLSIYGMLPNLRMPRRRRDSAATIDRGVVKEAGNGVMEILAHIDAGTGRTSPQILAITSVRDGDGKSTVSLLLAQAIARTGQSKVLLIDADPVKASVSKSLTRTGAAASNGTQIARPMTDIVVKSDIPNLDLIPAGTAEERNNRGLYLRQINLLFEEARGGYDIIIVDTPSLSAGSEALTYSRAADKVLLVLRFGSTRRGEVQGLVRKLREVSVTPQGVIFNFRRKILPNFISPDA